MCFGYSKEPSHRECPKHMFWLRNKKIDFQLHTLIWGRGYIQSNVIYSKSFGLEVLPPITGSSNYREVDIKIYNSQK